MITLLSLPENGDRKKYYAVNNPLVYTFQAGGAGAGAFNTYSFTGRVGIGDGKICVFPISVLNSVRVGDIILIDGRHIRTIAVIRNISTLHSQFEAVLNIGVPPQMATSIVSINNYRSEFRVFHGRKELSGGQLLMRQVGVNVEATPDAQGIIKFNVQPYLKPFVSLSGLLTLGKKNTVDRGVWGRFYVQYRERWEGDGKDSESGWIPNPPGHINMRWWVSAVRQLKQASGVSMHPEINSNPYELGIPPWPLGHFLTSWKRPEYYVGFPNEVSFGWPDLPEFAFLNLREEVLGMSRQVISSRHFTLLTEGRQEINRVRIAAHTVGGFVRISISPFAGSEAYVQPGYVLQGYVEEI